MFPTPHTPALEFKGNLLTLMVLHLLDCDLNRIAQQLADKISKAPGFFQQAPVVIDLHAIQDNLDEDENENQEVNLSELVKLLRTHGLIPVAIRGGTPQQNEIGQHLNLGLLAETKLLRPRRYLEQEPEPEPEQATVPVPCISKVVAQPIRSGQQVVALQGDLIVLAAVSHGAEILAHGHIHVYGALRGRALAGVNGDCDARIFCRQLEAELVSIAGQYLVNEDLPENLRGKPAQIYLEDESLKMEPL